MNDDHTPDPAEEQEEAEERAAPPARVVHAAVAEQGEDELNRPVRSLFWSGLAAGFAIMTSVAVSGALHRYLPDTEWREAIVALGYPVGFLIVILGRLQLFTEHTMVAILPFAKRPTAAGAVQVARLWSIVFVANIVGAAAAAALVVFGRVQSPEQLDGMIAVSAKLLDRAALDTMLQAIPAGFLIASIAWIRSAIESDDFWVVLAITYAIALCGFAHVIAGAAEAWLLLWHGDASIGWALAEFIVPAFVGNVIGGTGLFALLIHTQVKDEI